MSIKLPVFSAAIAVAAGAAVKTEGGRKALSRFTDNKLMSNLIKSEWGQKADQFLRKNNSTGPIDSKRLAGSIFGVLFGTKAIIKGLK